MAPDAIVLLRLQKPSGAVGQGTWETGEIEPPTGISRLVANLDRKEEGTCALPDGRLIRIEQKQLPYSNGRCGADPTVMLSLYVSEMPVIEDLVFYDCHNGYSPLALVLEEGSLRSCTWLDRNESSYKGIVTYFQDYKCRDVSRSSSKTAN